MKDADFDHLVGLIYESALDPGSWHKTMCELARQMDADLFHLLGWNNTEQEVTLGVVSAPWMDDALAQYAHCDESIDPYRELVSRPGHGSGNTHRPCFDAPSISKNGFDEDARLPHGMRYVLSACLVRTDTTDIVLGLMRSPERGRYTQQQETYLERLIPHFNRSLRLMERTQAATHSGEWATAGQDAASFGVIAVNKARQLLYCSRNGEALLNAAEMLRLQNGAVICASEAQEKAFAEALDITARTGHPVNLLLLNHARSDERYSVTLIPLPKRGEFALTGEPDGVLCLVVPLDHRRMATAGQLMQLFGLSAAEARLARAMAAGETLEFYASESALKLPTVKSQLRAVFEKTGTDRQAALVRLIAGIPAVREPD
jgi:DNA-binding CsgD family transcriptional regulator